MITATKSRVIKDYAKLDEQIAAQIKLEYPYGFEDHLISFTDHNGNRVSALPFETEEKYYLVRMTIAQAQQIIEDDEDFDGEGSLRNEVKLDYEDKLEEEEDEHDPYADQEEAD